jgi:hypothetical protein
MGVAHPLGMTPVVNSGLADISLEVKDFSGPGEKCSKHLRGFSAGDKFDNA